MHVHFNVLPCVQQQLFRFQVLQKKTLQKQVASSLSCIVFFVLSCVLALGDIYMETLSQGWNLRPEYGTGTIARPDKYILYVFYFELLLSLVCEWWRMALELFQTHLAQSSYKHLHF